MVRNVGSADKVVRYILGLIIIALGVYYKSWWGLIGLVPIVTALVNFCPLYSIIGVRTVRKKSEPTDGSTHAA